MQLFAGGLRASRTSCDYSRAIIHAKDKIEELEGASGPLVPESGEFTDGFKWQSEVESFREVKVGSKAFEEDKLRLMKIKVTVAWEDSVRKPKSVELVSLKTVSDDEK